MQNLILLCDTALRDEATKKYSLIGLFNRLQSATFPTVMRPFHVFCQLTDVAELDHCLTIGTDEEELFRGEFQGWTATVASLKPDLHLVAMIPALRVPREGVYAVRLSQAGQSPLETELLVDFPAPPPFREIGREELGRILADPAATRMTVAELQCRNCRKTARYGINLDPYRSLPPEVRPLPMTLVHQCDSCGTREWLGNLKAHLLEQLGRPLPPDAAADFS